MNRLLIVFCTLVATIAVAATPRQEELKQAETLYLQGLQAQKDNDLKAARKAWEQAENLYRGFLTAKDFDNASLRYNLANVQLAQRQLGKAIYNYRRALTLNPQLEDARHNLTLAREQRKDHLKPKEGDRVLKTLFAFHYDLNLETRKAIFLTAYSLFFLILILRLMTKKHTAFTVLLWLTALIAVASTASLAASWSQQRLPYGVITAKVVHAKSGSSNSYQDAFEAPLHDGTEFILLGQDDSGQWLNIQLENNQACWIPSSAAQR